MPAVIIIDLFQKEGLTIRWSRGRRLAVVLDRFSEDERKNNDLAHQFFIKALVDALESRSLTFEIKHLLPRLVKRLTLEISSSYFVDPLFGDGISKDWKDLLFSLKKGDKRVWDHLLQKAWPVLDNATWEKLERLAPVAKNG